MNAQSKAERIGEALARKLRECRRAMRRRNVARFRRKYFRIERSFTDRDIESMLYGDILGPRK